MSESKTLQSLKRSVGISLLAVVLVGCPAAPEDEIRGARAREVTILYTNDFESAYDPITAFWRDDMVMVGGVAELATLIEIERDRAELSFLLDAFPFIDFVNVLEMTGAQILDVLEQSFSLERGVLQVAGTTVEYDLSRPIGDRVRGVAIAGEPLDDNRTYSVTTLDFLASGADLYSGFTRAKVIVEDGPAFAELLEARFAAGDPVTAPPRGRLIPAG